MLMLCRLSEEGGRRSPSFLDLNEVEENQLKKLPSLKQLPSYPYT